MLKDFAINSPIHELFKLWVNVSVTSREQWLHYLTYHAVPERNDKLYSQVMTEDEFRMFLLFIHYATE